ncbi:Transcription factor mbp1 [Vermiconidia calcicola]|uniref:Transcription factor mbp1 n=1 Tax=Vermiconidia calcicola TaxID=1690605 RepID=A0ACC3NSP7_9PEZI|nr:Transcription factor mbp1 [Vermiconidia calcicola]
MARNSDWGKIYSATYSNVPVYELNVNGNHVMRRRSDDWINATHILKVAEYDKPTRTRILEREVQKGVHEKVQGGYGKYQGTWIPLPEGADLAAKNGVYEKLKPMFDYVPGDRSPPPAPKHATAASSKPRVPRAPAQPRRQPVAAQPDYEAMDTSMREAETPDNVTVASESAYGDYDGHYTNPRKKRKVETPMSQADKEFRLWADDLLDYFVLQDNPLDSLPSAPAPPTNANLNSPIDDKGHTALHWAAAMGDIEVIKELIRRGASIDVQSKNGETPLMRAVVFTNSFDRQNMERVAALLIRTVNMQEWFGSTVFHHIANTTQRKSKYQCARYYMDCLLNKMAEVLSPQEIELILNYSDQNGDTAITIAARTGARKCVRSLIGRNAAVDIPNNTGETADQLIVQLNHRRQERATNRQLSSSPFQAEHNHHGAVVGGAVQPHISSNGIPFDPLIPHTALNANSASANGGAEVYRSEGALTITSQIMPVIFNKAKSLASSFDAEIAEKEAEKAEAERVAAMRQAEIQALKKQAEELKAKEMEQTHGGTETDEQQERELEELEEEVKRLTEKEEAYTLKKLIAQQTRNQHPQPSDDELDHEAAIREKLHLARQLASQHRQRHDLVKQIVHNLSMAGWGENQEHYKRLISGALGVKPDDVEGVLPDIVSELEEWRGLESVGA